MRAASKHDTYAAQGESCRARWCLQGCKWLQACCWASSSLQAHNGFLLMSKLQSGLFHPAELMRCAWGEAVEHVSFCSAASGCRPAAGHSHVGSILLITALQSGLSLAVCMCRGRNCLARWSLQRCRWPQACCWASTCPQTWLRWPSSCQTPGSFSQTVFILLGVLVPTSALKCLLAAH